MADDLYAAAEQARQQSDMFLQRSREQMQTTFASQRAAAVGSPPGAAAVGAGGGAAGGAMLAGTPAGRLMETITNLIRRGAGVAGGAIGGPLASAAGGTQAFGSMIAGGAQFMAGNQPFGPAGMGSGALLGAQRNMSTWQMLYTAFGSGMGGTMGRWAGQRMDMTQTQAIEMAKEEVRYRLVGGARKGLQTAWNYASLGLSNFMVRKEGLELDWFRKEDHNRSVQQNLRFMTSESLERAGLGGYRGAFPTGITREGADVIGGELRRQLGDIQRRTGASAEQLIAIQGRAMGTMGALGLNRAMEGGLGNFQSKVMSNIRNVREIQQTLNLSEEEADQFFRSIGQMYGTAGRIAEMARTSRRAAGRMGMDVRDVFGILRQFEDTGRTQMIGQAETGAAGLRMAGRFRDWQRRGIMMREEAMMYGGRTYEEGLQIMTQRAFQMGTQMFERGQLGGMGLMMRYSPGAYQQFAQGNMGALEMAGRVGGMVMGDPTMQLRARFDERIRRQAGEEGLRAQYLRVEGMARDRQFLFGTEEEKWLAYGKKTNMAPLEAKRWYKFFDRESKMIQGEVEGIPNWSDMDDAEKKRHQQGILALTTRLRAEGKMELTRDLLGGASDIEAVGRLYRESVANKVQDIGAVKVDKLIRDAFGSRERRTARARANDPTVPVAFAGVQIARANIRNVTSQNTSRGGLRAMRTFFASVTGETITTLAQSLAQGGLTEEEVRDRMLKNVVDDSGGVAHMPRGKGFEYISDEAMAAFGLDPAEFPNVRGGRTPILHLMPGKTNPMKNKYEVAIGGTRVTTTFEKLKRHFPLFAKDILKAIETGTEDIGDIEGFRAHLAQRGTRISVQERISAARNRITMGKFRGMAGYVFGGRGAGMDFAQFATEMLQQGGRDLSGRSEEFTNLMGRMPEVEAFLEAASMKVGGQVNVGRLQKFFGDDLAGILEDVTGRGKGEISKILTGEDAGALNKLFDKETVHGLFRHVLNQQNSEAIPLGSEFKAMTVRMNKDVITPLADAIGKAVAKYAKGD